MDDIPHTDTSQGELARPPASSPRPLRLPSMRSSVVLATVMLGLGVAAGAAIGPSPEASFAGGAAGLAKRLPLLIAALASRPQTSAGIPSAAPPTLTPAATPTAATSTRRRRKRKHRTTPTAATPTTAPAASEGESGEAGASTPSKTLASPSRKLPAISSVWLVELAGVGFSEALAQPSAASYISGQLVPAGTLLSGWSALAGSAFASDATILEKPAVGAPPPLLHSIVQPPCPEGAAGASCASGPGALRTADEFLKATLAHVTTTPAYREHGLVVVTFATVAVPTQSELPVGASTATLTSQPPAGVVLLSPFAHAGSRSTVSFNPTSPRQSVEALLR